MLIDRNGQAKVLSHKEIQQLFEQGFRLTRDKALFATCFYTACRVSEARQMHFVDAFHQEIVRDDIIIRKANTKGKQATRTIPTHPHLKEILQRYRQDSLELLRLRELFGRWSHRNLNSEGKLVLNNLLQCPVCEAKHFSKQGWYRDKEQVYLCKKCNHYFHESKLIKCQLDANIPPTIEYDPLGVTSTLNYGFLFAELNNPFLFPGWQGKGCLSLRKAINVFEMAFDKLDISGASSHSCRRTSLTIMHSEGVILRVLQEISGHKDLGALQKYLEVSPDQTRAAIHVLG
ncbi:tyrosine-type recombinase/integrase [Coleofasciculus sp. FACHB-SPT9]|uniref:tyrosine-type recombinase/integrase n=1 Tax=Cyanophyceae TaxID=3028117 RepID=UPI001681F68C|nr:tyrosine-type recombinase/integrase [Coleofasciculus sp. FACHB-SPT9]MBD1890601.1 tyrosine-type recombinase/integrase [Coleofasciculus sp. FACHB-SPT9]